MHRALGDESFHLRQRRGSDSFSFQGNSETTANVECILRPFLPAASAAVGQMQDAICVFVDGETQPTRYIGGVGRRRKLVCYGCNRIVFASTLNDLINKARLIRSEDPGKTNYQVARRNLENAALAFQLGFAINA